MDDLKQKIAGWIAAGDGEDMVRRLIRNYDEDCGFSDILDKFAQREFANMGTIPIGKTPNVLAFGGAKLGLDMVINPTTILKCMSSPDERFHGHGLDKDIFKYLVFELRNPSILLRGSKENTLVAVTDLMDREGRPIIVSVALNRKNAWHSVNQITSAYGRNDFDDYLQRQVKAGNLLAINKNKAYQMLRSAEVQFPTEDTLISFDNSIAYTFENVKMISTESLKFLSSVKSAGINSIDSTVKQFQGNGVVEDILTNAKERSKTSTVGNGRDNRDRTFEH